MLKKWCWQELNFLSQVWGGEVLAPSRCTPSQVFTTQGKRWSKTRVVHGLGMACGSHRHDRNGLLRCGNPPRLSEGTLLRAFFESLTHQWERRWSGCQRGWLIDLCGVPAENKFDPIKIQNFYIWGRISFLLQVIDAYILLVWFPWHL